MKSPLPTNTRKKPIFQFSQVVVVENNLIGVVVKSWGPNSRTGTFNHDVYVRSYNTIENYEEDKMRMFVYDKELTEEALIYYE